MGSGPCLYWKAKQMKRLQPHLRFYVTKTGIGSYVTQDYLDKKDIPSTISGGLFTLYIGKFFRFSEILRVDVVKTNTKEKHMLEFTLKELAHEGKHKKVNWIIDEDLFEVKRIIEEKLQ